MSRNVSEENLQCCFYMSFCLEFKCKSDYTLCKEIMMAWRVLFFFNLNVSFCSKKENDSLMGRSSSLSV